MTRFRGGTSEGSLRIDEYNHAGAYVRTQYTSVPVSQSLNCWLYYDVFNHGESASC